MIRIKHQSNIRADSIAYHLTGFHIQLRIWIGNNRRHPRMKLYGFISLCDEFLCKLCICFWGIKPSFYVIADHNRTIGRNLVFIASQQLINRDSAFLSTDIPESKIECTECTVSKIRMKSLPCPHSLPDARHAPPPGLRWTPSPQWDCRRRWNHARPA